MTAKIHINLAQGLIEVEGEPAFVELVYSDLKSQIIDSFSKSSGSYSGTPDEDTDESPASSKKKRKSKRKPTNKTEKSGTGASNYTPHLDKTLELSGLKEFYGKFDAGAHPEKVLIFAKFLDMEKNISPCTADQIFTCYSLLKERIPKVFLQAIRDADSKRGFVDYKSTDEVIVTTIGENYFNHDLKIKQPK